MPDVTDGGEQPGNPTTGPAELREAVAKIWRQALAVPQVADADHFFYEGGHSVLAVEVAMSLRALTRPDLPLDILYEHPVFGDLVEALAPDRTGVARSEPRPLTSAEERLWFVERLHPGTALYHICALYHVDGQLDGPRLSDALNALAGRHEALRRGFEAPGRAFALEDAKVPFREVDAGGASPRELRRMLDEEAREAFDLACPPLARALLVHGPDGGDLLLLTVHHLVCDWQSLSLLEQDLQDVYEGRTGRSASRPPIAQAVSPGLQDEGAALRHWRAVLAGVPDAISLPYDRPRPRVLGVSGGVHSAEVDDDVVGAVLDLAGQEGVSPFMAWVAAYAAGLVAVTGERDLVITVPVSARTPERRDEVGMFVDTLPLRITVPPGVGARGLLRLVRRGTAEALAHQQLPLQTMVEELRLGGDLSRAPLAQVALSYVDESGWRWSAGGVGATRDRLPTATAKYELLWSVTRRGNGTGAELEYNDALFSAEAAAGLHARLLAAVGEAFGSPDAELPCGVPALPDPPGVTRTGHPGATGSEVRDGQARDGQARDGRVRDGRVRDGRVPGEGAPRTRTATVPELVHRWAGATPDAVAIRDGERLLTYREVDARAVALAGGLRSSGVGSGAVVAVPLGRGADTVVTCLGVLRAGCAYLPIDRSQPPARNRRIVEDAADCAITADEVTYRQLDGVVPVLRLADLLAATPADTGSLAHTPAGTGGLADMPAGTGGDGAPSSCEATPDGGPEAALPWPSPEDAAYVISTSGSTGTPKGVAVPHRAISRLVPDADYVRIAPSDRVAHLSNPAFDAATFEMWGALTGGATLVVVPREVALSPTRLRAFLADRGVTVMFLTTALFHQVVDFAPDAFRHLRVLLFGGEKHDPRRLERLLNGHPPARLVHVYGPTENTTFSTFHDVSSRDLVEGTVPIGGPISATTAYVLDPGGRPVAVGDVGELHLGGAGLALGYHRAPAATAAAFVPDPFGAVPGARLYRTGDKVRLLPGGRFAFVGRDDDQVKIRGFRVELGEVEHAVRGHGSVGDVAVVVRPAADGPEIVAYVSPAADGATSRLDADVLTGHLRRELPDFMVPRVVVLDRMPVNANGKIDRSALPGVGRSARQPARGAPARGARGVRGAEGTGAMPPANGTGGAAAGSVPPATAPPASAPPRSASPASARHGSAQPAGLDERVAALWREVLETDEIHPGDSFFALGGQSIKALRLLARIDEEFGVELELADFFDDPTLRATVAAIRSATELPGREGDADD